MATSGRDLVWQYRNNDDWLSYSSQHSDAIDQAYACNESTIKLKLECQDGDGKSKDIEVKLERMGHEYADQKISVIRRVRTLTDGKFSNVIVPRYELAWQWEGDGGQWTTFSGDHMYAINEALDHDLKKIKLTAVNDVQLEVKLDKMVQRNCTTGWERRVRCLVKNQFANDCVLYNWKNARGRSINYDAKHSMVIEAALRDDLDTVEILVGKQRIMIEIQNSTQMNVATKIQQYFGRSEEQAYTFPNVMPAPTNLKRSLSNGNASSKPSTSQSNMDDEEDVKPSKKPRPAVKSQAQSTKSQAQSTKSQAKRTKSQAQSTKSQAQSTKSQAQKSKSQGASDKPAIKTVRIETGHKVPIDGECFEMQGKAHVYIDGTDIYDAMLNQTNLKNNNNKYYIIQLLEDNAAKMYSVWFRWGRVGNSGQHSMVACGHDLSKAKSTFEKKYWDKTRNEWDARTGFQKVAGKYDMLKMDYSVEKNKGGDEPDAGKMKKEKIESKLDPQIQDLIQLICNLQAMEDMVVEMKYDAQKAPLGKLTVPQIKAGYAALKKIETCMNKGIVGDKLISACDEFYTRIPHNFGMRRPPVIKTREELKMKIALLEALGDIQVAMTILRESRNLDEHPIDNQYHSLKCKLKLLLKTDQDFKMITKYVENSHASTHNQYNMKVQDVFELEKEGELERFNDIGNNMLLWHGSRLTNWAGILGQGLRIAPPEAPVTGYMFGKGVYFADMSSKSANYCFASRSKNDGILLLSQVSLGKANELLAASHTADKLPKGRGSVKGLGKTAPKAADNYTMSDGTIVPLGKGADTGVSNPNGYTLNYNEFIVYDTKQIRMRYLVKIKFNFK